MNILDVAWHHGPSAAIVGSGRVPGDRRFDVVSPGPTLESQRAAARSGGTQAEESVASWSCSDAGVNAH